MFVVAFKDGSVAGVFDEDDRFNCNDSPPCGGCDRCCLQRASYAGYSHKAFHTVEEANAYADLIDPPVRKPVDSNTQVVKVSVSGTATWEV